jgi:ankyrin repeat protein
MNEAWIAAVKDGDINSVRRQLDQNPRLATLADKRFDTINGRCDVFPLRFAASQNNREIAAALIQHGADVNARDPHGNMIQAAGSVDMLDFLVANGADVNGIGYESGNAVILASYKAQVEKLKRLIDHGANVNQPAVDDGRTALHVAAGWGYQGEGSLAIIRLLLEYGARIDARDLRGQTPLHWAVQEGNIDAVKILVREGADGNVRDINGKTPIDYAENDDMGTLLKGSA